MATAAGSGMAGTSVVGAGDWTEGATVVGAGGFSAVLVAGAEVGVREGEASF
jgi:hypothetical protein